jgi:sigma-E factor negative regulatory protein RseA
MTDDQARSGQSDSVISASDVTQLESLSALMDGEASDMEQLRLLRAFGAQENLRETWSRYQLAAMLVRREPVAIGEYSLDVASRVSAALAQESVGRTQGSWREGLTRFAVAASVAALVVSVVQWRLSVDDQQMMVVVTPPPVQVPAQTSPASTLLTGQPIGVGKIYPQQVRYESYLNYHMERASMSDSRGMVPLAPRVSAKDK